MAELTIQKVASVGQDMFKHPDYDMPLSLEEVLSDYFDRLERLESMYVSVSAEIRFEPNKHDGSLDEGSGT